MSKNYRAAVIALAIGLSAPLAASAAVVCVEQPGVVSHTVTWFEQNEVERKATVAICRDNRQLAQTADCLNSEAAQERVGLQRMIDQYGGKRP